MTTKLKLVGAKTYYCEAFRGGYVLEGGVVELEDDKLVKAFLKETYTDALNNVHPVFVRTTEAVGAAVDEDDDDAEDDDDDDDDGDSDDDEDDDDDAEDEDDDDVAEDDDDDDDDASHTDFKKGDIVTHKKHGDCEIVKILDKKFVNLEDDESELIKKVPIKELKHLKKKEKKEDKKADKNKKKGKK